MKILAQGDNFELAEGAVAEGARAVQQLRIFGVIGDDWEGENNTAQQMMDSTNLVADNSDLTVMIESPGGSVNAGLAMFNALEMLKMRGVKVRTVGMGTVMSMATSVFMAGDERLLPKTVMVMVHNPQTGAQGEEKELEFALSSLRAARAAALATFEARGLERDAISSVMEAGEFMTADRALELGIATEVVEAADISASADLPPVTADLSPEQLVTSLNYVLNTGDTMEPKVKAAADAAKARVVTIMKHGAHNVGLAEILAESDMDAETAVKALDAAKAEPVTAPVATMPTEEPESVDQVFVVDDAPAALSTGDGSGVAAPSEAQNVVSQYLAGLGIKMESK